MFNLGQIRLNEDITKKSNQNKDKFFLPLLFTLATLTEDIRTILLYLCYKSKL